MAKPAPVGFGARSTSGQAARQILVACADQVGATLERADDRSNIQHLHAYRVSLRRLRSAMRTFRDLFAGKAFNALRRRTADAFGPSSALRDIDVQIERLRQVMAVAPPHAKAGLAALLGDLINEEIAAAEAARQAIAAYRDERVPAAIAALVTEASTRKTKGMLEPIGERAKRIVGMRVADMERDVDGVLGLPPNRGERLARGSPEALHRLRISVKRLRYTCESFALLRPEWRQNLGSMVELQDVLGAIHDADVLVWDLERRLCDLELSDKSAGGLLYVMADARARGAEQRARLDRHWRKPELEQLAAALSKKN